MTNVEKAYQFFNEYPGHLKTAKKDIADRLNIQPSDITKAKQLIREDKEPSFTELDEFAQQQGFNPDNASLVWYKNKDLSVAVKKEQPELDKESLYEFLSDYDYQDAKQDYTFETNDSFAVLNLFDAHIDKLAYTGKGGYWEAKENAKYLLKSVEPFIKSYKHNKIERIVIPIGNDFFNTNDANPSTKKGTPQPYTMHWEDGFKLGIWFYRTLINRLAEVTNVHVINIAGNHDKDKVFYLGEVIKALYEGSPNVTVDLNQDKRKYTFIHKVLLGFSHGDIAKRRIKDLPTVMAVEQSDHWGQANHRCWILGDIHHKEEYKSFQTLEHNGVDINFFRPATSADKWHTDSMWISSKKSVSSIIYLNSGTRIITDEYFI